MIIPFLSIVLRDIYFIKVRSTDYIQKREGDEEINLKVREINKSKLNSTLSRFMTDLEILYSRSLHLRRVYAMQVEQSKNESFSR